MFNKIRLNTIIKTAHRSKGYEVFVNGTTYHFPNKRNAKDFTSRVDAWLNDQFDQLNTALINVYTVYRKINSFLENGERAFIGQCIKEIEKSIDMSFVRSSWDTWTVTTFAKLKSSFINLEHAVKMIEYIAKRKNYTIVKHEIRIIKKMVQ